MELYALSVCPICDAEGMNRVWKQDDGLFISLCESCDSLSMVNVDESWNVPIEVLVTEFAVAFVHLVFGISHWLASHVGSMLTKLKPSTSLKAG
jgi:hypothetical protein